MPANRLAGGRGLIDRTRPRGGRRLRFATLVVALAAGGCGADSTEGPDTGAPTTTTTVAAATTAPTTTTTPPTTTTTPPTTTTTLPEVTAAEAFEAFVAYWLAIGEKRWDDAIASGTGSAAEYAGFSRDLDRVFSQPSWTVRSSTDPADLVSTPLGDGRQVVLGTLELEAGDGVSLVLEDPVVSTAGGLLVEDWGGPHPLSSRMASFETNPDDCGFNHLWAYLSAPSVEQGTSNLIVIARMCASGAQLPLEDGTVAFSVEPSVQYPAAVVGWEGAPSPVPGGEQALVVGLVPVPTDQLDVVRYMSFKFRYDDTTFTPGLEFPEGFGG